MVTNRLAARAATPNRPARLNRALLTVAGLLLLLGGAYLLLRGLGLLTEALGLPGQDPQAVLLPPTLSTPEWLTWVVIVAGVVIGLLCLRWLLAQTGHRARSQAWQFADAQEPGQTRMDSIAAATAVAAEIETYTGVHSARAVLTGDRGAPQLHLTLGLAEHASLDELRARIDAEALPRLRQALELDTLPTEILVRLDAASAASRTS
ncbi:alkaline shock response membrane anchor protein AmaP [Pseudonocardia nantongensis]|uniref:alkaline shock response membrane anchor protein AmaP n=1 Tax=Pseudonocardia nantongensis TaxID=1181885 RepID=UPI003978F05C